MNLKIMQSLFERDFSEEHWIAQSKQGTYEQLSKKQKNIQVTTRTITNQV